MNESLTNDDEDSSNNEIPNLRGNNCVLKNPLPTCASTMID